MEVRRAYRLRQEAANELYGFGDPMDEVPIYDRPLLDWQKLALRSAGLELVDVDDEGSIDDDEYLLFDNDLFFTKEFLGAALNQARSQSTSCQFCLEPNRFNARFVLPGEHHTAKLLPFNFYYKTKAPPEITQVVVPQKIYPFAQKLPTQLIKDGQYTFDQCDSWISAVLSPFHLLQINMAMLVNQRISIRRLTPDWFVERFVPVNSWLFYTGLRLGNKVGRRCKIHRTAVLEGAMLGDDVTVGAHSVVRMAKIGSGSTLEDQSSVWYSVLGDDTYIANKNHLSFSMTYEGVFLIHGPYQFSIFGRRAAAFAVINCDVRLDQETIKIPTRLGAMDSGQPLLGVAYGHGSKVAGGNIVAPGRIVPNGCQIPPPKTILISFT